VQLRAKSTDRPAGRHVPGTCDGPWPGSWRWPVPGIPASWDSYPVAPTGSVTVMDVGDSAALLATSDLHVGHPANRELLLRLHPGTPGDWLIVAGDVAERMADIEWALELLAARFAKVIWTPGNHELWTIPSDPVSLRGEHRYRHLVELCRSLGVATPEDSYPIWAGVGGPVTVAPLFLLYDYSFRPAGTTTKRDALAQAYRAGVVCTDELVLHPDPYTSLDEWCAARVAETERRLAAADPEVPLVLVNHHPLVRQPTSVLRYAEFALWCGTDRTADWHRRFNVAAVVYGHLHIRRTSWYDGLPFMDVSVGYPREWAGRAIAGATGPCRVLPFPEVVRAR
jgi:3',5'-cyclic AMP phosphodiesterase CpdA